ncbi:MAG: hypothetical protein AAF657_23780, partial [Acidobacteriota bacterium]
LHLGGLLEAGNVWPDTSDAELSDLIYSGLVFVGRQTFIGPMYIGYSQTDGGDDAFYFFLGRVFGSP